MAGLLADKFPIAAAVFRAIAPDVIDTIRKQPATKPATEIMRDMAPIIEARATADPETVNAMNMEAPLQSRTTLGMAGGLLTSLGAIYAMLKSGAIDMAVLGPLIASALACLYGLYGRWWPGLKPLFHRR